MSRRRRVEAIGILLLIPLIPLTLCLSVSGSIIKAESNRSFSFPRDHGNHPEFQTEWWYLSGNLRSETGMEWGYQYAIFRHSPVFKLTEKFGIKLPWNGYAGHLVITNLNESKFHFTEDWGNPFFGYAGARDTGSVVWLGRWNIEENDGKISLVAGKAEFGLDLKMEPGKPPVLNGMNGLSFKDGHHLGSSYHYSVTSLKTKGTLKWGGEFYRVEGKSWLDREFGSSIFSTDILGWDWFSFRLDDDSEIMVALFRSDEDQHQVAYGTMVFPDGSSHGIKSHEIKVETLDFWTSPETGGRYPIEWRISLAGEDVELFVKPYMKNHELHTRPHWKIDYWEGPVNVSGSVGRKKITGKGYAELTGYVQKLGGKF
jgi:predicted secreted hydrolase